MLQLLQVYLHTRSFVSDFPETPVKGRRMEQYSKYSDEELIQRLRAGETGIADYLIEKYKYLVRRRAEANTCPAVIQMT